GKKIATRYSRKSAHAFKFSSLWEEYTQQADWVRWPGIPGNKARHSSVLVVVRDCKAVSSRAFRSRDCFCPGCPFILSGTLTPGWLSPGRIPHAFHPSSCAGAGLPGRPQGGFSKAASTAL